MAEPPTATATAPRRALITGITGQDGSYLADLLLAEGTEVHGIVRRRSSASGLWRIRHIRDRIKLHEADLLDILSLISVVESVRPHEIYNLAAQSFVPTSFAQPILTAEFTALGVTRMLEAVRLVDRSIAFYQASSSEMFGLVRESPQSEATPFHPRSPYGVAKVYGHMITVNYREAYGLHACCGIMFNHESPRRSAEFVTRKVSEGVARIKHGKLERLTLGNLDARRDWGYAGDYVRAMPAMLRREKADDYVIATGKCHSIRDLLRIAFGRAGLEWERFVDADPALERPAEVDHLRGDASKAKRELGWEPEVEFEQLVEMMVDADLERIGLKGESAPGTDVRNG